MTPEEYYWRVRRPALLRAAYLRAKAAGNAQAQSTSVCEVSFEGTNCRCKINGEERVSKVIPVGSNVTVEVIPNEGYAFTKWDDGETANPRTWTNVQGDFVAKAELREDIGPLCFYATDGSSAITLAGCDDPLQPVNVIYPNLNLQYSYDNVTWQTYDMTKAPTDNWIEIGVEHDKIYFKAETKNENGISQPNHEAVRFIVGKPDEYVRVDISGNLMYLLDANGNTKTIPREGFKELFNGNESIISMPQIQADNLGYSCCESMFYGCNNLKIYTQNASGRIPWSVNASGTVANDWSENMLAATGGDFTTDPQNGTTYYIGQ